MWDGLMLLLLLSLVMGGASFAAGILPLSFALTPRQLRLITALGTGVLVGTALIVIIPEGVETLYAASGSAHSHAARDIISRRNLAQDAITARSLPEVDFQIYTRDSPAAAALEINGHAGFRSGPDDGFQTAPEAEGSRPPSSDPGHEPGVPVTPPPTSKQSDTADREPHVWIGVSLIAGFILMYLIDTLPQHLHKSSQPHSLQINLNSFSFTNGLPPGDAPEPGGEAPQTHTSRPSSTTIGLVIHAAADGIALGASSTSSSNLSFIIFIALMIHKAPAAFGLTSVLLKQGLSKRMARTHLIIFSAAAPAGALFTFLAIHGLGYGGDVESASTEFFTGVLLLFSGGTFLYVAMHTLSGSGSHSHDEGGAGMNGYAGVPVEEGYGGSPNPTTKREEERGVTDTLVTVGGMLLPLLTQFGHGH
ncbi:putative zinc/iron permease [Septoria linicola]|nr:putative zinc/iron permease [Septoria linicola]